MHAITWHFKSLIRWIIKVFICQDKWSGLHRASGHKLRTLHHKSTSNNISILLPPVSCPLDGLQIVWPQNLTLKSVPLLMHVLAYFQTPTSSYNGLWTCAIMVFIYMIRFEKRSFLHTNLSILTIQTLKLYTPSSQAPWRNFCFNIIGTLSAYTVCNWKDCKVLVWKLFSTVLPGYMDGEPNKCQWTQSSFITRNRSLQKQNRKGRSGENKRTFSSQNQNQKRCSLMMTLNQ